jgi:hypothetical protein
MIKLLQSSPNPAGIRFDGNTTREFSFRASAKPKDSTANITYTIESPGAAFANGNPTLTGVAIGAGGTEVRNSLGFKKTGSGTVLQVVVKARVQEVGGSSHFDVFWVVPVLQAPSAGPAAKAALVLESVAAADVEDDGSDPLDPAELRHTGRVLRTLQAALDVALEAGSPAPEEPSDSES